MGEWESGRKGEWENGRVGEWGKGRMGLDTFCILNYKFSILNSI
jgi:hypothetical protein